MLSRITTTPSVCPVSLDILRRHVAIDSIADDDLLEMYGQAATELAENFCGRMFLQKSVTWILATDDSTPGYFPMAVMLQNYLTGAMSNSWLHLPNTAVSIDSVKIGQWGDVDIPLVLGTDYQIDIHTDPARVRLLTYAGFNYQTDHIAIAYTTGFGSQPTQVPAPIRQAIMVLVTRLKEHRGDEAHDVWCMAAESLLAPYNIFRFGGASDLFSA